jgi:hypothetical protein
MSLDMKAIADALAARYAPGVVTPPTGYPNIVAATANPPNALLQTPYVVVWPQSGDLIYNPGQRKGEHEFMVNFYYARSEGDIPRESAALNSWLGVLLDRLHGQMQLGLSTVVMKAMTMSWSIGALTYAGTVFDGITLTDHVWTADNVTLTP